MAEFIHIDTILTRGRTLASDDDISGLAKSIQDSGQQVPIIVDSQLRLIDGLRRIEALRFNGNTVVHAVITSIYSDAEDALRQAKELADPRHTQPFTYTRAYETYKPLIALIPESRSRATRGVPKKEVKGVRFAARKRLCQVLGLRSESELQALVTLFRMRDQGGETGARAQAAIEELEAGNLRVSGALARARPAPIGEINNLEDQRNAFTGMVTSLGAVTRGIDRMGRLNPRLSKEEVADYMAQFAKFRATITRFVRTYTEENNKR